MKKQILDLRVKSVEQLGFRYSLIKLTSDESLPTIYPGQFVEVRVDHSSNTFLRRPISVNFVDVENRELWLLVAQVGHGTRQLSKLVPGEFLNCLLPLGNHFTIPTDINTKVLFLLKRVWLDVCHHGTSYSLWIISPTVLFCSKSIYYFMQAFTLPFRSIIRKSLTKSTFLRIDLNLSDISSV